MIKDPNHEGPMRLTRPAAAVLGVVLLAMAGVLGGHIAAQEKANPIAAQVKASLKDPAKPFTMLVLLTLKEGNDEKFEAAFAKALKATRREKGCLAYDLNRDTKAPLRYVVYERWQNLAALEAHLKTEHITTLLAAIGEMLAGPPEVHVLRPAAE